MDSLYNKLISEAEEELKALAARNAELKERLAGNREHDMLPSLLEGEITSLIMMSHMENTKQVYRVMEELKREEEEREREIARRLQTRDRFRSKLLETVRESRSRLSEL
ncbi:hypothetical protein [Gorillibacterium sp. sgz5001074]|uniref:hypothetical protein n=1 Tax=Gorillibacterium sp. sgz5001074 TaxID=3446695 RepID=UPI003F66FC77